MAEGEVETGYHAFERQRLESMEREGKIVVWLFVIGGLVAGLLNPFEAALEWLFSGWWRSDDDDEPAPDYSRAERIVDEDPS